MRTIDDVIGKSNNFDALRLVAAIGVIFSHAFAVIDGSNRNEFFHVFSGGQKTLGELSVAVFFVISGFLITQSFCRSTSVIEYCVNRVLRIVPGLIMLTLLTCLVLGPIVTNETTSDYWSSYLTFRYLGNALIYPSAQRLPGVFETNIYPVVTNASIWTLSYEFNCYVFLAGLGLAMRRAWLSSVVMLAIATITVFHTYISPRIFIEFSSYFLGGGIAYAARKWIFLDFRLFFISIIAIIYLMANHVGLAAGFCFFGTYSVIYIAYLRIPLASDWKRYGDLSYGTYLYAWPVQQVLAPYCLSPLVNFLASIPVVLILARLSWVCVERPSLARKKMVTDALIRSLCVVRRRLGFEPI